MLPGLKLVQQEVCVRAAVGLRKAAGLEKHESLMIVNEDAKELIFKNKADKGIQDGSFTFDSIFSLDAEQDKVFLELLRPLLVMVPLGYSVSLLLWEANRSRTESQFHGTGWQCSMVQQVIDTIFQELETLGGSVRDLYTVSFVQFHGDGKAHDLLSPSNRALQVMEVSPLGLVVEEVTEIVVSSSKAASSFYSWGNEDGTALSSGCLQHLQMAQHPSVCGSLFTITVERDLEGCGHQRSAVRIFEFPGQAGPCAEPFSPLLQALAAGDVPAEAGFLPRILKQTLEGNSFTFLLLCLTVPDASAEEILSAFSLAEQVRGLAKKVSPTLWDPAKVASRRRAEIQELRAQLLFRNSHSTQDSMIGQLQRALRELQVLKNQSWEKKKAASEAKNKNHNPGAKGPIPLWLGQEDQLVNQVLTEELKSQVLLDKDNPKQADVQGFVSFSAEGGRAVGSSPNSFGQLSLRVEQVTEDQPSQGARSRAKAPTCAAGPADVVRSWSSQHGPALELQFSLAKARRQCLQQQHWSLIRQERLKLEGELAGKQELPPSEQEALSMQKEKAILALQLEALRQEQAEAEKDLEALYQQHRWEVEAQKQHTLQVFRAYRNLSEERTDALDQRYRKLLRECLQDAIHLSAQNQQLRAHNQLHYTTRATQTD
ncbi:PREDICTED: uncharacterized protein LOC109290180 isoform X2 [Gavialis gangeticus]|uniref:uncharacterized protein LOC109290180 isoform X2 n=1 Tax=Gavialis gangeticus TaxID=94835 RepID=UPI00092EE58B|nr:PREDICTED: uncharacterized protein LOC109290180 isoform X2 [Gavialis gangeticus]